MLITAISKKYIYMIWSLKEKKAFGVRNNLDHNGDNAYPLIFKDLKSVADNKNCF